MQTNATRVIAAVVDTHNLTLYKEDGETIVIPQGDPRIRPILDTAVPNLVKYGYAYIDLSALNTPSEYAEFEKASSGAVKLFRVAKTKLMGLFGKKEAAPVEPVAPMFAGNFPVKADPEPVKATVSVVEDILQHAIPVASPEFHEAGIPQQGKVVEESGKTFQDHSTDEAEDTIIAVVNGHVIPGMEKIKTQFGRAATLGSTQGVENFLQRLGAVINDRKHSVEDLLKFMERGDLPIADDGSILIYKVLNLRGENYVDCYTDKVEQWVGGYVCMDPYLVDHNRKNECSNGLHVARRGYVRNFSGNVCVLAKVAPEDVIAVPDYDANKMRVCGYHIIAELTREQYNLVKQNRPITETPDGKILLAKAMAGQHIGKTHEIRITGHRGTGVQVTSLEKPEPVQPIQKVKVVPVEALANPEEEVKDVPLDPKEVVQKVEQLSRKEQAAKLYADYQAKKPGSLEALLVFKKTTKVSWEKLGIPAPEEMPKVLVEGKVVPVEVVVTPKKAVPAQITPELVSAAADAIEEFGEDELERFRDEQKAKKTTERTVNDVVLGEGSPKDRIQKLLAIGLTSVGVARAVLKLKKKSKKSWSVLGVSDAQVNQITQLAK